MTEYDDDSDKTCPTCGRDDFASERGMNLHHTVMHEDLPSSITKECKVCGDEFTVEDVKKADRYTTCGSDECQKATWSRSGENHSQWGGDDRLVTCEVCGETGRYPPSQAERNVTCGDDECKAEIRSRRTSGENHYRWDGGKVEEECVMCGGPYDVYPSQIDKIATCSPECRSDYLSDLLSGENNPMWRGGTDSYYGENWHQQREKRVEYDNGQCVECGMTRAEHIDTYGYDLHVHHVTRVDEYRRDDGSIDDEQANRLENLRTFCHEHHGRWEGLPVGPET